MDTQKESPPASVHTEGLQSLANGGIHQLTEHATVNPGRQVAVTSYLFGETGRITSFNAPDADALLRLLQPLIDTHDAYRLMGATAVYWNKPPLKEQMTGSHRAWTEIDPPDSVWKEGEASFAKLDHWRKEQVAKLQAYEHPPSRIIDSGRGIWAEWWFNEFVTDHDTVEGINYALGKVFGSDHCWNINRLGRMPGTINHKTGRKAAIIWEDERNVYSPESLPFEAPPASARTDKVIDADVVPVDDVVNATIMLGTKKDIHPDATAAVLYGTNADGEPYGEDRSDMLFFWLCECVRHGVPDGEVLGLCVAAEALTAGGFGHLHTHRKGKFKGQRKTNVERNARRQLANAYAKVAEPKPEKFNNGTPEQAPADEELVPIDLGDPPELGEDRDYIIEGRFERGAYYMVGGKGGEGKSAIMLQVAAAIALGLPTLTLVPTGAYRVLTLNAEDSRAEVTRRLIAIQKTTDWSIPKDRLFTLARDDLALVTKDPKSGKVDWTPFMGKLVRMIEKYRIDVVVLDPLVELHRGLDEISNTDMSQFAILLKRMIRRTNILAFVVHHNRKGTGQSGDIDSFRGATALINGARGGLTVETMSEEFYSKKGIAAKGRRKDFVRLGMAKQNYEESMDDLWLRKVKQVVTPKGHTSVGFEPVQFGGVVDGLAQGTDWEFYAPLMKLFEDGNPNGRLWAASRQASPNIRKAMQAVANLDTGEAERVIQSWLKAGYIVEGMQPGKSKNGPTAAYGIKGDSRFIEKAGLDI